MKISTIVCMLLTVFCSFEGFAQENVFLNRDYWKANPSIEQIEADISAENNIAALTPARFDPVCYALLEKVDNATIKYLLTKKGNAVDKLTHDGRTYIFWAAYKNNLEIMKHLVAHGAKANINDSHGYSVLNFASVTGQTNIKLYDFLLDNKADINATNNDDANALLLVAPFAKNDAIFDYFIAKGLDLKSQDKNGNTIFHYAAKGGHVPVLKSLIQKGIAYNTVNKTGSDAMLLASTGTRGTQNSLETYAFLEKLGLNPNTTDNENQNPLHAIAHKSKDLAIYKYFVSKGVSVNQQDINGNSPFMNAAKSNSLEVVKHLFSNTDDINTKNKDEQSALTLAVSRNSAEVIQFLLENDADISTKDKKGNSLAYYLVNNFNPKKKEAFETKLKNLEDNGLSMVETQHNENTLLHIAANDNNLSLLKRLEAYKININQKNAEGNTALHLAAMSGKNDAVLKYLLAKGADKSIQTAFNETVYDLVSENELLKEELASLEYLK